MSGHDLFISYSRADRAAAHHFAECFALEGFSVWWDAALHSGETFDEVIETELRAAKAVVVLWSPRSVASRWVRAEATLADRRKKFAPVIIEACDRPIIFELSHTPDLSEWNGDPAEPGWQNFIKDLRRLVERGKASESAASASGGDEAPRPAAILSPAERFAKRPVQPKADPPIEEKSENLLFGQDKPEAVVSKSNGHAPVEAKQPSQKVPEQKLPEPAPEVPEEIDDEFHCLEINVGDKLEKRYVVNPLGLKIGRAAPADIIVTDGGVSRAHCLVVLAGDRLHVSDLNSTNGTFIDGKRVNGSGYLKVGSVLKVGNATFTHARRTCAEV